MPVTRLKNKIEKMRLTLADPEAKVRAIQTLRIPLHDEIKKEYGELLRIAPTFHVLPIAPQEEKEGEVEKLLKESIQWLKGDKNVYSTFLYELVDHNGKEKNPPKYLLAISCKDSGVIKKLKLNTKGKELQQKLMKLSRGKGASDKGLIEINSMLIGTI